MVNAFTAIVSGQVQGVGYRFFVKNKANSLKLTGWVRNLPDETVEIEALGNTQDLEQLLHFIESGPIGSRVDKVLLQWFQAERDHQTFEIRG